MTWISKMAPFVMARLVSVAVLVLVLHAPLQVTSKRQLSDQPSDLPDAQAALRDAQATLASSEAAMVKSNKQAKSGVRALHTIAPVCRNRVHLRVAGVVGGGLSRAWWAGG